MSGDKTKQNMIEDLIEIGKIQGIRTGKWEANEFVREEASEEYLEQMIDFADDYGIKYGELEEYRQFDEDEEFELQDYLGTYLFNKLTEKLMNELL